jgi:hypothetical protein
MKPISIQSLRTLDDLVFKEEIRVSELKLYEELVAAGYAVVDHVWPTKLGLHDVAPTKTGREFLNLQVVMGIRR